MRRLIQRFRISTEAASLIRRTAPLALIATIAVQATTAAAVPWKNVRISGAGCWVTGIVAQPLVPNLFYIRTDVGGCYRWDATENTWVPITDSFPVQQRYSYGGESIAVDPTNADTVYIAAGMWLKGQYNAGPGAIFKSSDEGRTWTKLGLQGVYMGANDDRRWDGERLVLEPGNSQVILFGSRTQGLWRSSDGGAHWSKTALPYPRGGDIYGVQSVAFDPKRPQTVYAAVSRLGIFRSTDAGVTWANVDASIAKPGRLAFGPDETLWCTYGNGVAKETGGVWTDVTPAGHTADAYAGVAIDPSNAQHVLVSYGLYGDPAPDAIYVTSDGGATWRNLHADITTDIPWYNNGKKNGEVPFDISNLLFDPNNAKSVWFVSGGGIWNTPNIDAAPSPTFFHKENGHEELCVTALAAPPSGPELVAGVMDVDGFAFDRGIDHYPSHTFIMNGTWANATGALAYEETDPSNMARLCVQGGLWNAATMLATSTDGGYTWNQDTTFPTASPLGSHAPMAPVSVAVSASDPANILVCSVDDDSGNAVLMARRSAGAAWSVSAGLPNQSGMLSGMRPIASDPVSAQTFYAYLGGNIYRSTDGGVSFTRMSSGPIGADGEASFYKLTAMPGASGDLWLSEDQDNPNYLSPNRRPWEGLYHSADAGRTWSKVAGISRALTFAFGEPGPSGNETLYVYGRQTGSTLDTVLESDDLGAHWSDIGNPAQRMGDGPWDMVGSRQTYGRVFIGTGGRGIYYSTAPAPSR